MEPTPRVDRGVPPLARWARQWRPNLALVWLASVVVLIVRRPDAQLVYEDGVEWFVGARTQGLASLLQPYAGYPQVIPRMVGLLEALAPAASAPLISTGIALGVVGIVGVAAYRLWPPLALVVLLLANTEQGLGSPTFLHFYLGIGLVVGVVAERVNVIGRFGLAAASLAGPFGFLMTPVYLARWWQVRDRDALWRAVAVGVPAAVVGIVILAEGRSTHGQNISVIDAVATGAGHLTAMLAGRQFTEIGVNLLPESLAIGIAAGVIVLVAATALRVPRRLAALVIYLLLVTIVATVVAGTDDRSTLLSPISAARYFYVEGAAVAGMGLVAASRGSRVGVALLAIIVVGWIGDVRLAVRPPSNWASESACFDTPGPCIVHVFPGEQWDVHWPD